MSFFDQKFLSSKMGFYRGFRKFSKFSNFTLIKNAKKKNIRNLNENFFIQKSPSLINQTFQ
jgi:hypothetical protein